MQSDRIQMDISDLHSTSYYAFYSIFYLLDLLRTEYGSCRVLISILETYHKSDFKYSDSKYDTNILNVWMQLQTIHIGS